MKKEVLTKSQKERSIRSKERKTKAEMFNEVGKGMAKVGKNQKKFQKEPKILDRRVTVSGNTKIEVFKGDARTDEQVIADYKAKYNK